MHIRFTTIWEYKVPLSFFVSVSRALTQRFSSQVGIKFKTFYDESNTKFCVVEIHDGNCDYFILLVHYFACNSKIPPSKTEHNVAHMWIMSM